MLKIMTNKEKLKAFFENVLCSLPLLSMMAPGQAGQPHCSSSPNTPLEAAQGIRPAVNKHKPTKEKLAFKQPSQLVELKSSLGNREYQVGGSKKEKFC